MKLAILIVTHNSQDTIESVLKRLEMESMEKTIFVLDNASTDQTKEILARFTDAIVIESETNLGFCAGNNLLLNRAYKLSFAYFLFLNPDAAPLEGSLTELLLNATEIDALTPKIVRGTNSMTPLSPSIIDASGIYFTSNFRHLDRGSGEVDSGQFNTPENVAGGTGAALLVPRLFVERVSYKSGDDYEFFDERFFAYREDADLALRANRFGLKFRYIPTSVFTHVRRVTPERRDQLSPFVNALSIRNRFLLLLNHYSFTFPIKIQLQTLLRNLTAFGYAFLFEPQSRRLILASIRELKSHLRRRAELGVRTTISNKEFSKLWLDQEHVRKPT